MMRGSTPLVHRGSGGAHQAGTKEVSRAKALEQSLEEETKVYLNQKPGAAIVDVHICSAIPLLESVANDEECSSDNQMEVLSDEACWSTVRRAIRAASFWCSCWACYSSRCWTCLPQRSCEVDSRLNVNDRPTLL